MGQGQPPEVAVQDEEAGAGEGRGGHADGKSEQGELVAELGHANILRRGRW